MLTAVPYLWVPILSVLFYSFLLIASCSAKKSKLIYAFMRYMFVLLLWTGGSMFMRLQMAPGYTFWYQVSIIAVFALPFAFYDFVYHYLKGDNKVEHILMEIMTVTVLVLTYFQVFLPVPDRVVTNAGKEVFVYTPGWQLVFPTIMAVILVGLSCRLVHHSVKVRHNIAMEIHPTLLGALLLIVGNVISVMPGNVFPFDTFAGLLNAGLVFFTLTKRKAFKLTLLVSPSVILYCTLVVAALLSTAFIDAGISFVGQYFHSMKSIVTILAVAFTLFVLLTGMLVSRAIGRITLRREQVVQDRVKNFSLAVSKSLDVDEIMGYISEVLCQGIGISHVMIFMLDPDKNKYTLAHTVNPLDRRIIEIDKDVPYIEYIRSSDRCLMVEDFKRSTFFRSMWDSEKELLEDSDIACITAIRNKEELTGIILIGGKDNKTAFNYDDLVFIESIQSISNIALNNAILFEETKKRADIDSLTGLLNRNAFLARADKAIKECKGDQLSLAVINLDDFRLYNELYGTMEGDRVLSYISSIIRNSITASDICGRYSGKVFAICFPGKNQMQALHTTENIRLQLLRTETESGGIKMKKITFCAGICSIPYGASNLKELLTNANMQVYSGKRTGKDKIITYQSDTHSGEYTLKKDGDEVIPEFNTGYEETASTIYALTAAIDAKDHYTFKHSSNVAAYSAALARKAELSDEHVRLIHEAGLLHDVGKIAIPEKILSKPGRLEADEYDVMKTHVDHSIEIIRHLPDLDYLIPTVVGHHERWDGRGYPNGLAGNNIPMGARCLSLADSFDAMTSKRSYKEAFSVEYAAREIKEQAGKQFDPQLAMMFVDLIESGDIQIDMQDTEAEPRKAVDRLR